MEDRASVVRIRENIVITVADGHGGDAVAEYLVNRIPDVLKACDENFPEILDKTGNSFAMFFHDKFAEIDKEISWKFPKTVGATLCVVCIGPDFIVSANCGDTMTTVGSGRWSQSLSAEHKAGNEMDAIVARGGHIVNIDMPRVNGMLNLSRSMGDFHLKPFVSCNPFVRRCESTKLDYAFVATDGVWDVMNKDDVHDYLMDPLYLSEGERMQAIVKKCRHLGSTDNIAIVLAR